jgi:hypothetical protein
MTTRIALGRVVAAAACALLLAADGSAQTLSLRMADGRVTIDAENAPIGQVLERWAEAGEATIVNGDTIASRAVTLHLVDVPEREALATLLRNVAGYILTSRPDAGASRVRRIVLLPTGPSAPVSSAGLPRRGAAPATGVAAEPGFVTQPPPAVRELVVDPQAPTGRMMVAAGDASASANLPPPQLGVYDGRGVPNVPTVGVTSEDDLSRYADMLQPLPEEPAAAENPGPVVPANPFTTGSTTPSAPPSRER